MKTLQADKSTDKTGKTPVIRMGREVTGKKGSAGDSDNDAKRAEKKEKEKIGVDQASSLV